MTRKVEPTRNLAFVLSEASGHRSRDTVTIQAGEGSLEPGTLLGFVSAAKKYVASPEAEVAGKEGAEVASAILAYGVTAGDEDVTAVIVSSDAEVKRPMLVYHASVDTDAKRAAKQDQLRKSGIKAR